jgi:hypothetical protein
MYPITVPARQPYPTAPIHPAPIHPAGPTYPAAPPPRPRARLGLVAVVAGVVIGLVAVAGVVLAVLGFFSGSVARADVAAGISTQLGGRGVTAASVDCPQDLRAEVGESVRCTYTVDGKPVGVTARVTTLQGDQAVFDITSDAPLVTREDVAAAIDDHLEGRSYATDGPTSCPTALIGEQGRSVRCEFAVGGQPVDAVATVSSVADGRAEFDIALQARPVTATLLQQDVARTLGQDYSATVDDVTCDGGLTPTVGDSVLCTAIGGGDRLDLQVAVASVDDGLISYRLQAA